MSVAMNKPPMRWRSIPGTARYVALQDGTLWNVARGSVIRGCKNRDGYLSSNLRIGRQAKVKTVLVHRLVAAAWGGKSGGDLVVDHVNGDKMDNRPANLRFVTPERNACAMNWRFRGYRMPRCVYRIKSRQAYRISVCFRYKCYTRSGFKTIGAAVVARDELIQSIGRPV